MKETFYFQHDYNATQDPKMMSLLANCGLNGIGMYWILIEILHQQKDSKITEEEYNHYIDFYYQPKTGRSEDWQKEEATNLKQVFIKCGLLLNTDGYVYSERVIENKKRREEISEKRSLAGKISAEKRLKTLDNEQMLNKCATSVEQRSTRKGKEKKRNIEREPHSLPIIKDYFKEIGSNDGEATKFFDHFESNGWKVGGKATMKNWKAAARNWARRSKEFTPQPQTGFHKP